MGHENATCVTTVPSNYSIVFQTKVRMEFTADVMEEFPSEDSLPKSFSNEVAEIRLAFPHTRGN